MATKTFTVVFESENPDNLVGYTFSELLEACDEGLIEVDIDRGRMVYDD